VSRKKKKTEEEDELSKLEAMKEQENDASVIEDIDDAFEYIMSGNAEFEFRSKKTGTSFTYQVKESNNKELLFVSIKLDDGDKWPFKYFGIIVKDREGEGMIFIHGKPEKARIDDKHPGAVAFRFGWNLINNGLELKDLEIRKTAT